MARERPGACCGAARLWVWGTALLLLAVPSGLRAEEPKGCGAFKWPLTAEAAKLQKAGEADGTAKPDDPAKPDGTAYALKLVPLAEAHLPQPPERKPKVEPSRAGYLAFAAPAAGAYQVAVSQAAWIDVVQDGRAVKSTAFTGATDCPGVRKSIRFELGPRPFLVQVSGTAAASTALLVEPVPQ